MQKLKAKLTCVSKVTSTNDVVRDMAKDGADDFTVLHADVQTAGRGRRGRSWSTIPKQSMALSVLLRQNEGGHLPLITALAVCQTVRTWVEGAQIKWPNDVLVAGKKISGILVERFDNAGDSFYVVGTGLNIGPATDAFWQEMPMATSLAREGVDVSFSDVASAYLKYLSQMVTHYRTHGWDDFLANLYIQNCVTIGENVTWNKDGEIIKGKAISLDADGTLVLQTENGNTHKVYSGDIVKDA